MSEDPRGAITVVLFKIEGLNSLSFLFTLILFINLTYNLFLIITLDVIYYKTVNDQTVSRSEL